MQSLEQLILHLKESGILKSLSIENALRKVDRKKFVSEETRRFAYEDRALATFESQTISQPTTVVFMLELLNLKEGDRVLDIGAGSGWVSCLIATIVGKKGFVDAFELDKVVGAFGLKNIKESGLRNINYQIKDASVCWGRGVLYDKIHAGAAFKKIPVGLSESIEEGGIFVGPTQDGFVMRITKKGRKKILAEAYPGFSFVPFIEKL